MPDQARSARQWRRAFQRSFPPVFWRRSDRCRAAFVRSVKKDCSESICYRVGFYYQDRDYKVLRTCSYPTNVKCFAPSFAGANSSAVSAREFSLTARTRVLAFFLCAASASKRSSNHKEEVKWPGRPRRSSKSPSVWKSICMRALSGSSEPERDGLGNNRPGTRPLRRVGGS